MLLGRESNRTKYFMCLSCVIQPTIKPIDQLVIAIVITDKMRWANLKIGSAVIYIKGLGHNVNRGV